MATMQFKQTDMTKGNILPLIISFSIPLLIGSLFQTMYNTVDSVVIGNFVGTGALAAVGACFSPMLILLSVMIGISGGVTVLVSQVFGRDGIGKVGAVVATANGFFILSVIPLTVAAILLMKPLLSIIDVPEAAQHHARVYLLITFGGLFGTFGYNLNAGILRGLGDSRSPLVFLLVAFFVNVVLDLLFVLAFGWGVAGVALATVIAQVVSWLYGVWHIKRHYKELNFRLFSCRIERAHLREMLRLGLPMVINHGIFSLGFLLYYRFVNGYGPEFMAGYAVAGKIANLTWLPISSLGTAAITFAGQNGGAGNMEWLNRGVRLFLKTTVAINIVTSAATLLLGRLLLRLFTPDAAVIDAGFDYLLCLMPFYWIYAVIHILTSFMNGVGDVRVPTWISVVMFWGIRVPLSWYISLHYGANILHLSYPISWVIGGILTVAYFRMGRWRHKVIQPARLDCECEPGKAA